MYDEPLQQPEHVSWSKALLMLGIYAAIGAVMSLIGIFLFYDSFNVFTQTIQDALAQDPEIPAETVVMFDSFFNFSLGLAGGISAAFTFVSAFIGGLLYLGLIHLIARFALSGEGFYSTLVYKSSIMLIVYIVVTSVIGGIVAYFVFSALPSDPAVWEQLLISEDTAALEGLTANFGILGALNCINVIFAIGVLFWQASIIGNTYNFGTGKGCVIMIISWVVVIVVYFACIFAIFAPLMATVNSQIN